MTLVYSHPDPAIAALVANGLENEGIAAQIKGDALGAALGEVPPIAAWVEVWIADDSRADEARAVVREATADVGPLPDWTCATCGETVEGQFGACWQCSTPRPAEALR